MVRPHTRQTAGLDSLAIALGTDTLHHALGGTSVAIDAGYQDRLLVEQSWVPQKQEQKLSILLWWGYIFSRFSYRP